MTTQEIQLETIDDKVKVTTPYNQVFVQGARNLRGKWKDDAWWFDDSIIDHVRNLMDKCFNTTGEHPYENVSLVVKELNDYEDKGPYILFGRTIARAFGRDSGAKLGDDIVLFSGSVSSGGSMKNWCTYINDASFEIQNYPEPMTERVDIQQAIKEGWVEIKRPKKKRSEEEIRNDIEKHEKAIEMLKQELSEL